mmetsp:Transcript_24479/g.69769  ORF Transcript_24479/g.69769 Transcript_24479/m.69769 type:complete len:200 (+) Transcript_24479:380-979(+)
MPRRACPTLSASRSLVSKGRAKRRGKQDDAPFILEPPATTGCPPPTARAPCSALLLRCPRRLLPGRAPQGHGAAAGAARLRRRPSGTRPPSRARMMAGAPRRATPRPRSAAVAPMPLRRRAAPGGAAQRATATRRAKTDSASSSGTLSSTPRRGAAAAAAGRAPRRRCAVTLTTGFEQRLWRPHVQLPRRGRGHADRPV